MNSLKYEPSCFRRGSFPYLAATYRRQEKAYTPLLHSHREWLEITYVSSGSGEQIIGERNWHVSEGDLMICNCGVVHGENPLSVSNFKTYCFNFTNVRLNGVPENCLIAGGDQPILPAGERKGEIGRIVETMHSLYGQPGMEDACQLLAASFLALVCQMNLERRQDTDESAAKNGLIISCIEQYINRNYKETITLDSVAEQFHISRYYLSHLFRKETDFTFLSYLTQCRMRAAKKLLKDHRYKIYEVAEMVGYKDITYFSVTFKKFVGVSPSEYQDRYRD